MQFWKLVIPLLLIILILSHLSLKCSKMAIISPQPLLMNYLHNLIIDTIFAQKQILLIQVSLLFIKVNVLCIVIYIHEKNNFRNIFCDEVLWTQYNVLQTHKQRTVTTIMSIMSSTPMSSSDWCWNITWYLKDGGNKHCASLKEKILCGRNSQFHSHVILSMILRQFLFFGLF